MSGLSTIFDFNYTSRFSFHFSSSSFTCSRLLNAANLWNCCFVLCSSFLFFFFFYVAVIVARASFRFRCDNIVYTLKQKSSWDIKIRSSVWRHSHIRLCVFVCAFFMRFWDVFMETHNANCQMCTTERTFVRINTVRLVLVDLEYDVNKFAHLK